MGYCAWCGCDAGASYPNLRGAHMSCKMSDATWRAYPIYGERICKPDKAFTPHPAKVSKCNTLYPFGVHPLTNAPQQ
ncbi:hypothetical protein ACNKHR_19715 [Shigella flexneri]